MARKSLVQRNLKRKRMVALYADKRAQLKVQARDKTASLEDRFAAQLKLSALPRNSAQVRIRNRCEITGRARGYYRTLRVSRIMLRELGSAGYLPGMVKSSW